MPTHTAQELQRTAPCSTSELKTPSVFNEGPRGRTPSWIKDPASRAPLKPGSLRLRLDTFNVGIQSCTLAVPQGKCRALGMP